MDLTVRWAHPDHHLLARPQIVVNNPLTGTDIALPIGRRHRWGEARGHFGFTSQDVHFRVRFNDVDPNLSLLTIDQTFAVNGGTVTGTHYRVPDLDQPPHLLTLPGLHPLLTSTANQRTWKVIVHNNLVDVTGIVGPHVRLVDLANGTMIRVLAQTDRVVPSFWVTCTPKVCRGAAASDVLCFFTPPQNSKPADTEAQLTHRVNELRSRRSFFLGQGDHNGPASGTGRRFLDHFTPGPPPNLYLPHGWEQAVVDSGRRVALVLPVPASSSHNSAAGGRLPKLLDRVHDVLRASGDITPRPGQPIAKPHRGVAGHSLGGKAALDALEKRPRAFSDVILFDANGVGARPHLFRLTPARITLVGFWPPTAATFRMMARDASVSGRLALLPRGHALPDPGFPGGRVPEPDKIPLPAMVARSPRTDPSTNPRSLAHALSQLPSPVSNLTYRNVQHQYIVIGGDDEDGTNPAESHFLSQALKLSTFR